MFRYRLLALMLICGGLLTVVGCARNTGLPQRILALSNQPSLNCLKIGLPSDPGDLNPILHLEESGRMLVRMIHAGPLRRLAGGGFAPDLWKEWTVSKDSSGNLVVEGTWKDGLTWHDGRAFQTKDFDFTLEAIKKPENQSPFVVPAQTVKTVEHLEEGKKTRVVFQGSSRRNLEVLAVGLLPAHLLEGKVMDQAHVEVASGAVFSASASGTPLFADWPIGLGPFKVSGRKDRRFLELDLASLEKLTSTSNSTATPSTTMTSPAATATAAIAGVVGDTSLKMGVQKILVRYYYRPEELVEDLRAGRLDWAQVLSEYVAKIEELKVAGVQFLRFANPSYLMLGFNVKKAPFNRVELRRAVNLVLDRKKIREVIPFEGRILVGPPTASGASELLMNPQVAVANDLLEKAGIRDSDGDGIREDGGKPVQMEVLVNQESVLRKNLADAIVADLRKIGIKGSVVSVTWSEFIEKRLTGGQFDAFLSSFQAPANGNWIDLWGTRLAGAEAASGASDLVSGKTNFTGFSDASVDEALKALDDYPDVAGRNELREKVVQALNDQVPACFLFQPYDAAGIADSIRRYATDGEIWEQSFDEIEKPVAAKSDSQG